MWFIIILVTQCCALKQSLRVYGGIDARPDEYSFVVRIEIQRYFHCKNNSITYHHEHLCAASALSSVWVLSAAHCLENLGNFHHGSPYSVEKIVISHGHAKHLPGIQNSFSDVLFTITYPLYYSPLLSINGKGKRTTKHDIGLLKTYPMKIRSYVKLSAVDYKCLYGHEAVFAGFGTTIIVLPDGNVKNETSFGRKMPLQVLNVLISKCKPADSAFLGFCIALRCGHASTVCGEDSGGPLLHASGVIAVLSRSPVKGFCLDSNAKKTKYVVGKATPVTPYVEWIHNIMKNGLQHKS